MAQDRTKNLVCIQRVDSYNVGLLKSAIEEILSHFGGPSAVASGKRVLVKPNVLRAARPEEAVTTHPAVLQAVCEIFLEAGFDVAIGDGPGGAPAPAQPAFRQSGTARVAERLGVPLLNFQETGSLSIELPFGPVRKVNVAKPVLEADTIINVPKFKTHGLTGITCALKNPYGYIPGFLKGKLHAVAPKPRDFSEILCALWKAIPPRFSLVDAVLGMEGQGPSAGRPRQVGLVFGGTDPVAVDSVAATIMGLDPESVVLIQAARSVGLGTSEPFEIAGPPLRELVIPDFQPPFISPAARLIPGWLVDMFSPLAQRITWVRPEVIAERCQRCGRCAASCPTGAMQGEPGELPQLASPRECISCLCCQEICPAKAIRLKRSLALRPFLKVQDRSQETPRRA